VRRAAALLALLALAGCDGDNDPSLDDAGCGMEGVPADQPVLGCPAEIDLGCIPESGAALDPDVGVATCDGSAATVTCTPESVTPGMLTASCTATAPSGASASCAIGLRYAVDGPPRIVCPDAVTAACSGPATAVTLEDARVMASCMGGGPTDATSDAPSGGFAVGATDVTWTTTDGALSCATTVTVTDDAPPALDCPAQTVVRTEPDGPIDITPPSATDACDDDVELSWPGVPTERGTHSLEVTATDDAGGVSTCTLDVDVLDVFAVPGLRVISAALRGDGSTEVTIGFERSAGADVTNLRLERATDPGGPWTELTTVGNGQPARTYTDADAPAPVAYYRVVALAGDVEGGVAGPVRAYALADDGYQIEDQPVPGVPFDTTLYGVIRYPMDLSDGPFPLVVFLHGNHGNCRPRDGDEDQCETRRAHDCEDGGFDTTPNAEGYLYLQETLASQGFVTVSLSANALNCRDAFLAERTQLILEHLRRWVDWAGAGGAPLGTTFAGAVDLSRVALVGHSRGGEAVATVPQALADTPIAGIGLASVFGIGPTDYEQPEPSGVPFAVLLPACDADVITLEGLRQYDRGLDPTDAHERAQVLFIGANHNYFNSEWRFDDNESLARNCQTGEQVGAAAQRGMLEVVLADWIRATAGGEAPPAYLRAETGPPPLLTRWADAPLDLRHSWAAAERLVIDDFTGAGAPDVNDLGGANAYEGMIAEVLCSGRCSRNFSHLVGAVRPAWEDDPAECSFAVGELDASGWAALSMRFASRIATINAGVTEHDVGIRVTDAAGVTAEVALSAHGRLAHRYTARFEQEILATVRVPLDAFTEAAPGLDLSRIVEVEVGMPISGGNAAGSIWMSDLELAN